MRLEIASLLGSLPAALLQGDASSLLAPCSLLAPGALPPPRLCADLERRTEIARELLETNRAWGHPRAHELVADLAAPDCEVVVAGQQPGLFGGPMYSLTKLVAVVLWAQRLRAVGRRAVPIFWLASSDHDWDEIASCCLQPPGVEAAESVTLDRCEPFNAPVGSRPVPAEALALLVRMRAATTAEHYQECLDRLASYYDGTRSFAGAFASWWISWLGARAPLFLDAQLPALARSSSSLCLALLERHAAIATSLARREERIGERFSVAVRPQPDCPPLFVLDDGVRRRVRLTGAGFELRGSERRGSFAELTGWVRDEPERVSPGVLARPAIQDAVLEPTLFLVGPGELAYMTQASVVHAELGVEPALLCLRPHALILDRRRQEHLETLIAQGLDLCALLGRGEDFERALATVATHEEGDLSSGVAKVLAALAALQAPAVAIDPQLASAFDKTRGQVERALDALTTRAQQAIARRDDLVQQRARQLRGLLLPGGAPAERAFSAAHFLGLYGQALVSALFYQLDVTNGSFSLIDPTVSRPELESTASNPSLAQVECPSDAVRSDGVAP